MVYFMKKKQHHRGREHPNRDRKGAEPLKAIHQYSFLFRVYYGFIETNEFLGLELEFSKFEI
jgi:hypothetical protein